MNTNLTFLSGTKIASLVMSLFMMMQLQAQQVFEAENFAGSMYTGLNTSEYFSGGNALTMRASYGAYAYYQVTASTAGTYDMAIEYATMNTRRIYVQINDQMPAVVEFDDYTGGWDGSSGTDQEGNPVDGIKTKTIRIYLEQGENTLKLGAFDTSNQTDSPNIDRFSIAPSEQSIEKPGDQPAPVVLEAESGTVTSGETEGELPCYSGSRGVRSMNSGNDSKVAFNIDIIEEGTYDFSVFYTTCETRKFYAKINVQLKTPIICSATTPDWECPATPSETAPVVVKKTVQVYLKQGNNTIVVGAYEGWAPNLDKIEIQLSALTIEEPVAESVASIFDFTDNVASFSNDFTEEHTTDSINLRCLFDNNEFTDYCVTGVSSTKIVARLAYPVILTGYAVASSYENPVSMDNWIVEYSTDGQTWTPVAEALSTQSTSNYKKVRTSYTTDAPVVSAQYYRLTATGTTDVYIGEWQLFGLPYLSSEQHFPVDDLTGAMTVNDLVDMGSIMASDTGFDPGGDFNEVYSNVFDKSVLTKYTVTGKKDFWIQFELSDYACLKSYALSVHYTTEYSNRNPSKWTLEGYDFDQEDWITLDSREGIKFPEYGSTLMFNIANPPLCMAYKLTVEDTGGAGDVHLCQWQMFAERMWFDANDEGIPNEIEEVKVKTKPDIALYSRAGTILLNIADRSAHLYQVYNPTGQTVAKGIARYGLTEIPVSPGVYIVRMGSQAAKVIVE